MKSSRNWLFYAATVLLLAGTACRSKTGNSIPQLRQQVSDDSIALQELQKRYLGTLHFDFIWCDSMLAFVDEKNVQDHFDILNLAQAYLNQFNDMLPVMNHDIEDLNNRLSCLQNDIDTHYLNDSLAATYLADEKAVADTLHYRILYFEERLSQQEKALKSLKKNIRKETSK